ncbi:unnamed protein product [Cyclocybe aegerita]|uniref:Uncharacterized protein n=1 Tax=Cyclocybe aegerita TaxID=1973307 RepID=A0A8S0VWP5_CYCAE|nr:unnamed protein product [Cyclocybe aegerita]
MCLNNLPAETMYEIVAAVVTSEIADVRRYLLARRERHGLGPLIIPVGSDETEWTNITKTKFKNILSAVRRKPDTDSEGSNASSDSDDDNSDFSDEFDSEYDSDGGYARSEDDDEYTCFLTDQEYKAALEGWERAEKTERLPEIQVSPLMSVDKYMRQITLKVLEDTLGLLHTLSPRLATSTLWESLLF